MGDFGTRARQARPRPGSAVRLGEGALSNRPRDKSQPPPSFLSSAPSNKHIVFLWCDLLPAQPTLSQGTRRPSVGERKQICQHVLQLESDGTRRLLLLPRETQKSSSLPRFRGGGDSHFQGREP